MRGSLKYWLLLLACIAFAAILSHFAFFSWWYAPKLFHTAHSVRVCDAAGMVVLVPVRIVFYCFGSLFDQSTPYSEPLNYVMTNSVLLGLLFYSCLRPLIFRGEKSAK